MSSIPIVPVAKDVVTSFKIFCQNISLFVDASFLVVLYDVNNIEVGRKIINLTNEEYLEWKNDDNYIINLITTRLGFTLAPVVEENPSN
jgi:hypothetical protein